MAEALETRGEQETAAAIRSVYAEGGFDAVIRSFILTSDDPTSRAMGYLYLKDHDAAIKALEQGFRERIGTMILIRTAFMFEPLHDDPRYREIVRQMDFPPAP